MMGRDSLTRYLKERRFVPSVPPEKTMGVQPEPAWIGLVLPVPSVPPYLNGTAKSMPIKSFGEAMNGPTVEPPDPNVWRVLSTAYHAHHVNCPVCIAAGRGDQYGLRCGAGVALWTSYQNS